MAKKYWWEEDENKSTTQNQTKIQKQTTQQTQSQTEKKYWWDEVDSKSERQGHWWDSNNLANDIGNSVSDRVNSWLQNYNSYISDYQKRYEGRKGSYEDSYVSDSSDWLNTVGQKKSNFDAEASAIIDYMSQYEDYLDASMVAKVRNLLTEGKGTVKNIYDSAAKDNEYWSLFTPNEEQTAKGYTAEKVYNEWQAEQKQYASDKAFDVEAGMLELEALKKERDAYLAEQEEKRKQTEKDESFWDSLGRWLGTTPDTTIPLAGATETISRDNTSKYDQRISELDEQIKRAKYVQGYEGYMANMNADDYAANSQYVSTRTDVAMDDATYYVSYGANGEGAPAMSTMYDKSKLFGDYLYDYINKNKDALDVAKVNDTSDLSQFLGFDEGFLQTMSKDEIGVFNSIYKNQSPEAAYEFVKFIASDLKGRKREQEQAFWAGYAKESPFGSSVFSTLISPLKGISYIGQAADMLDDGKLEENAGYNRFSYIPSTIRSQVSSMIENGNWGKVGSFAYNTGMSMADFLFTTAVSGGNQALSLGIMGSGAAADATLAAKDRGLEDGEAFALGTIAGLAEVAMEKISLSAWLEGDMTEGALRYVLKNALSEGGEEAGTSIVNLLADVMIAGDKSEWNMAMQAYIDQGKSPQEAFGLVAAEQAAQIGLDALGGILSGAAIGGVTYGGKSVTSAFKYGDTAKNKESAQKLVTEGLELNPDSQYIQKAKTKLDNGKNLTGMQVRNILAANQEKITANDMQKIQKAAEKRLTDLGQTKDVSKIAEIATKWATGQDLNPVEKRTLTHSEYGSRVANELLPSNIQSGGYASEWAENIGTREVNKEAYNKELFDKWRAAVDEIAKMNDPATYKSLEDRVDEKDKLTVSKTGKATIRKSGVEIDLSKAEVTNFITDSKSGKITDMTLNVDGKEVKASDIDYADDSQSYLFSAVQKIENITPGDAQVIIRDYDPSSGLSVSEYLNGMDEAYTYGYHNYSVEDMKAGNFTTKLSDQQMMGAYEMGKYTRSAEKTAKTEAIKRMRTAVEAEVENARAEGKEAPKAKQMTITYNDKGKIVDFDKAGLKLTTSQKSAPALAKVFHEMGLGTNFELFASYVNKDGVRVYLDENGVEQKAPSGVYRMKDGTVRIDLNAYNGRGLTLDVMAHELTHFIQQWSDTKYQALADFLVQTYEKTDMTMHERVLREQARLKNTRGEDVSYNEAYDEVVANAMSKMLADGKVMERLNELKAQDMELAQKVWEGLKKLLTKFFRIAEKQSALFHDAADIMELKAEFKQMQQMWAEAFVEASENFQTSLTAAESQTLTEAGIGFDESTQSVYSLHFSNAYTEQIQVGKKSFDAEAIAQLVSKVTNRSITDARKWVQSEMAIANIVMQNPEFLDFEADNRYEAIKKNSDYPQGTVDLSNLCPKREEFTTMFDMLQKKYPNKLFTAQDVADMRKILSDNDITVACGACFVEDRRQLIGEIADTFIGMWKEAVDSGKPLQKTNAAGSKVELQVTKALAKQYGLTAGTKIMATDTYIPNQYDLTTYEGFKLLEKNHPTIAMAFNRYNNSRGQQSARLIEGRAEYKRQILGWSDAKVKSVNNNGGLRIFSFSDFEVVHLLDLAQVIIDCAAKGVKIQGYTKIPAFAKLVRDTGIKLNRSLIPKGDYGYHMENGKVVLDYDTTEGININDKNFMDESDNPNVGNIVIGINPTQIGAAMLDPFIDYIIPFHSNKAKEILRKLGTGEWVNYKESQHEKDIATGTSSKHNVNIYTEVINKYHPTNKVEFVEAFLKECKRQGKIPRYAEFLNVDANGDYAYREGYHKLLVDFKMFDAEGNILPQGNITPNLDEAFMKDLLNAEIDKKQNYEFPQKVYDDIDKKFGENALDNSSSGNENKITEKHDRGELSDSRGIREGTAQAAGVSEADGRRHSDHSGASQEAKSWDRQSRLVKNRLVGIVYSHIKAAKSQEEVFALVSRIANISKDELTTARQKNAIQKVAEQIYSDAMTLHPLLFDDKWRMLGKANELRSEIIAATKDSDYSRKDLDSDGRQITKEQQAFFKETKVVDKDGKLLVMYHGSSSTTMFTVFERRPMVNGRIYGEGYYFTEVKNEAQNWGGGIVYTVYVNLTNPYYASTKMEAPEAIVALVKERYGETYDKLSQDSNWWGNKFTREEYIEQNSRMWGNAEIALHNAVDTSDIPDDGFSEEVARRKTKLLKSLKYDGVIVATSKANRNFQEVVAFDSEQIKLTTNKNPTKNIDMRYSSQETDADYKAAVNRGDMETAQKMVYEAAVAAGYTIRAFHGTNAMFNVFEPKLLGSKNFMASSAYKGFFAAKSRKTAESYTGLNNADVTLAMLNGDAQAELSRIKVKHNFDEANEEYRAAQEKFFADYRAAHGYDEAVTVYLNMFKEAFPDTSEKQLESLRRSFEYDFNTKDSGNGQNHVNRMHSEFEESEAAKSFKELNDRIFNEWEQTELKRRGYTPNVKDLYLKITNPLVHDFKNEGRDIDFTDLIDEAKRKGHDGCIFRNVQDGADFDDIYVVFSNTQLKSADPVTYDDKGNVIPLSKRFNTENDDIRYSGHETDNIDNRSLLANAFEGITKDSKEYELIQEYKGRIKILNEYEQKLANLNAEIRKMLFDPNTERDAKKLKQLQDEAKKVAENINRIDKKLLSLEASEPLRRVIERERKKEAKKTKDHVKELIQNKKERAEQTELRHKIRKTIRDLDKILNRGNKQRNVKEDMKGFVSKALELADYLFTDHISNDELIRNGIDADLMRGNEAQLVKETEDILTKLYDEADSLTDEEFTRLDAKRKANEAKLKELLTAQRNRRLDVPVYNLFNDLVTEYASLKNSNQDAVKAAYNDEVERLLRTFLGDADSDRAKALQNMRVADMTTEELWKLYNAYTMVLTTVRDANKFHVQGMNQTIEQVVGQIAGDFSSRKIPEKKLAIAAQKLANKIGWDYEKLYYALDRIGSEAFTELIMNLADSENIVMRDIMEAMAFRDEIVEKYGFNDWSVNKEIDREFLDNTGKKFKMTLGQMMSLYAYSRRDGAWDHIEYGGFVFGEAALTNPKPADSYKLSKEQCEAITSLLTKEQKGYVEDMQKFLSETMGEKGNEVSMQLYGIKMFGEKNYFPIHIAGQFKAQANESQAKAAAGFQSMSNAGFTHAQNPNAKAPFVLEGFNEIWSDHVNEMSRYHGTVPALEDLRRVMNRSTYSDSVAESQSIKQLMENHYGKEAVDYFDNLYREANSGVITDKLQKWPKKLLSLFRKSSVAYSLSVLVQQPASVVRAYAMVDRKYFGFKGFGTITSGVAKAVSSKWNPAYANAYNEMLKYAPGVTMAKEIGGFDTATGGSIRSTLLDTNKSIKQKWNTGTALEKGKAVLDAVDNNAIANLPNVADKIAWIEIWNACKRETVAKHKDLATNSEEFMQIVGERFTEVIRATQVYDSIFAKSPMLKSKNLAVQYLVSFMNEPNTVANMAEKAVRDATRGNWKQGMLTGAVVIHSIIFTNMLKSIIYALRDDDEDETYIEKYIEAVTGNMMDDINPFNYIPIARDVVSIAQGYDVERADMAIVADALDALDQVLKNAAKDTEDMTEEELIEFDKKVTEANWKLVESLASFFGIPVKNVRREINAVIDHARIASANAGQSTANSVWDTISEAVIDSIPFMSTKESKTDKIYSAIVSGDTAYVGRLKGTYKTDSAYSSAVRKALRENDSRIHDAAQARYEGNTNEYKRIFREIQKEGKFTFDEIMDAINSEENAIKNKLEPDKVTSSYSASDFVQAVSMGDTSTASAAMDNIIDTHVANGETQAEAEAAFVSSVKTSTHEAYSSGLLDEAGAKNMLMEYADMDEEEAASRVNYWAFCEEKPEYDLTESNVNKYQEFAEPAGIDLDIFAQFVEGTKGLTEIKDEWGDVEVTKREQVLEVIDSLPLTWQQKDALYLAAGYSENKIWDVPW